MERTTIKYRIMKLNIIALILLSAILISCEPDNKLESKKKELTEAKTQLFELKSKISALEKEVTEMGGIEANPNLTLVTTLTVSKNAFVHNVDVRGGVQSRNNVLISAETPAAVKEVMAVEGQQVRKGQILIIQDSEVLKNNIKELQSSLDLATTMYERQKKLWEQNVGSEVQYLEMKNRKESLELKLATTRTQLSKTKIKAPFNGIVDMIDARVGEMLQPGFPIVRVVSMSKMYIKADVSESLIGKFKKGQKVQVYFPSTDVTLQSSVTSIGQVINPNNRTFTVEVSIPNDLKVKPNMITVLTLADYENKEAISIPTKIIQSDRMGKFVYKIEDQDGETHVKRVDIEPGITYRNETEIKSELTEGQLLVVKGGLGLADGSVVKVVVE